MISSLSNPIFRSRCNTPNRVTSCPAHLFGNDRQRCSPWPRGHILKSFALAAKPQVLENCLVLGLRTALFHTVEIALENARNLAENLQRPFFWFSRVEIA